MRNPTIYGFLPDLAGLAARLFASGYIESSLRGPANLPDPALDGQLGQQGAIGELLNGGRYSGRWRP